MTKIELIIKKFVKEVKEAKEILNLFVVFFEVYIKHEITNEINLNKILILNNYLKTMQTADKIKYKKYETYLNFFKIKCSIEKIFNITEFLNNLELIRKKNNENEKDYYKKVFKLILKHIDKNKFKKEIEYINNLIDEVNDYKLYIAIERTKEMLEMVK